MVRSRSIISHLIPTEFIVLVQRFSRVEGENNWLRVQTQKHTHTHTISFVSDAAKRFYVEILWQNKIVPAVSYLEAERSKFHKVSKPLCHFEDILFWVISYRLSKSF